MPSRYRYRPIHALCEKALAAAASLLPATEAIPVRELPRRVLVLKFGGMGEAVLARSIVEHLRRRNPSMEVEFLVEPRTAETMTCGAPSFALVYNPQTDGIVRALTTLREVRTRRYDAVVDFEQISVLTAAFMRLSGIRIRIGLVPPIPSARSRLFTHPIALREGEAMWGAFVRIARVLDPTLPENLSTVPLPYSKETSRWLDEWWARNVGSRGACRVAALHIGVGPNGTYRRWPVARFAELAARLASYANGLKIVLTGDSRERSLYTEVARCFRVATISAIDLGGIERTAALLQRCDLLVSADTGVMHLGAAMGTPTVGLFGPNSVACWAPVGPRASYVYVTRQPCSPCINSYIRHVPAKCIASTQSACMWDISVDHVLEAARRVIREPWLGRVEAAQTT